MFKSKSKKPNYRHIAELNWGTGGTTAYPTSRKGFYYYSCSSHGGYVVPEESFTAQELNELKKRNYTPDKLQVLIQRDAIIGINYESIAMYHAKNRRKSYKYNPALGLPKWEEINIFLFEEDCNWKIVEEITGVERKSPKRVNVSIGNTKCRMKFTMLS